MIIRVQYQDHVYDMISGIMLQRLLESGKVKMFYRYSEKRWIAIGSDPIRTQNITPYRGSERRTSEILQAAV